MDDESFLLYIKHIHLTHLHITIALLIFGQIESVMFSKIIKDLISIHNVTKYID